MLIKIECDIIRRCVRHYKRWIVEGKPHKSIEDLRKITHISCIDWLKDEENEFYLNDKYNGEDAWQLTVEKQLTNFTNWMVR